MSRCDSRRLDEANDIQCYEMAAKYYGDVLWKMAHQKAVIGISDRQLKEVYNG